jgi:hypothetical protein
MPKEIDFLNEVLVHFSAIDKHNPFMCLSDLAHVNMISIQRRELEWWFEAASTHEDWEYEDNVQRGVASLMLFSTDSSEEPP